MAWSFKKRKKIAPGVHLNFSKRGVSTSFGVKGFSITTGPRGTYLNTGIPGTGLYNRQKISGGTSKKTKDGSAKINESNQTFKSDGQSWVRVILWFLFVLNLLAFIGGILNYADNKDSFSPLDLIITIFFAAVSVACFYGLRKRKEKEKKIHDLGKRISDVIVDDTVNDKDNNPREIGKQLGKDIVNQIIKKYQTSNNMIDEKKNL